MKAFIVAALLVASVAGQSMDLLKLNKEPQTSMFKFDRPTYPMAYDTNRVNMVNDYIYDDDTTTPTTYYGLEEIMAHPRFQEYMSLPLFRQYWSYPMFQRYVCSAYFQRFWHIPAFKQYFMSPVLFYKYIYPCVTIFKYDTTTMNTMTSGDYAWNKDYYNTYPYNYNYNNGYEYTHVPAYCRVNTVYCRAVVEQLYQHLYNTMMRMPEQDTMIPNNYYNYNSMYNPIISRMMYGYNKQIPSMYNRFDTVETDNVFPYSYNKIQYPTRMFDDVATDLKYEQVRPTYNRIGMRTFDKIIKA